MAALHPTANKIVHDEQRSRTNGAESKSEWDTAEWSRWTKSYLVSLFDINLRIM